MIEAAGRGPQASRAAAPTNSARMIVFVTFQAIASVGWPFCTSRVIATTEVRARKSRKSSCGTMKSKGDRFDPDPVTCQPTSLPVITFHSAFV